jgi:hypothetical protein
MNGQSKALIPERLVGVSRVMAFILADGQHAEREDKVLFVMRNLSFQ